MRPRQGRPPILAVLCATAWAAVFVRDLPGQSSQRLELLRSDAELNDVCFVDQHTGWAAGDRGAIWHTPDGGRTWRLQDSGVRCRLETVTFLDAEVGWAAGGWRQPYTHVPHGVILRTRDGGKTWTTQRRLLLPYVRSLTFFDRHRGIAVTQASALYTSGIFRTEDGGQSWQPIRSEADGDWLTGAFTHPQSGALVGRNGAIANLRHDRLAASVSSESRREMLHAVTFSADGSGWLAGDGGLLLQTADAGRHWQLPPQTIPDNVRRLFDFYTVRTRDRHTWVAGAPGTRVFHTANGGRTWTAHDTGHRLPIRDLTFINARQGWAVGALGAILATRDGGRTWHRQRAGGERLALAGSFGDPADVPLELFADLCGGDGYLGQAHFPLRRDLDPQAADSDDWPDRAHEALIEAGASGASSAWQFPIRQAGLRLSAAKLVETIDRATDGDAAARLELHLTRHLRMWRPEVVITHHPSLADHHAEAHLIHKATLQAVRRAADATSYPDLATEAGLTPWTVKKVYGLLPPGDRGTVNVETSALQPHWGRSLADVAADARGLLIRQPRNADLLLGFRQLLDYSGQGIGSNHFFAGLSLPPGGSARRPVLEANSASLERLRYAAQKRRNMQALLDRLGDDPQAGASWPGQLTDLTRDLDPAGACHLLQRLALTYAEVGRLPLAAATLQSLIRRHPHHPLADSARLWLVHFHGSSEVAWQAQRRSVVRVQQAVATVPVQEPVKPGAQQAAALGEATDPLETAGTHEPLGTHESDLQTRLKQAMQFGKQLEQSPQLAAEPAVGFALASARRQMGYGSEAEQFYRAQLRFRGGEVWKRCAAAENWLQARQGACPKSIYRVHRAVDRPHLDGRLDEALWQSAGEAPLTSALGDDRAWPAVVQLACDQQYLYLALQCRKAPGAEYRSSDEVRRYDADLSGHDRVEVLLDLDRDYATWYRLTIDHRGWTGDACWKDAAWNPRWFVAAKADDDSWSAEAAIAWSELTGEPPQTDRIWALGVQRTVPGVGFQSWTQPAGTRPMPAGFGFLWFQ